MDLETLTCGKISLKPTLTVNYHYNSTALIVVGCGGTGGRIIPLLAQHIANHNKEVATNNRNNLYVTHKMELILYDSKSVLPKNLDRQHFYQFDLLKNKAQVMAERYSALYGIDIKYYPDKYVRFKDERGSAYSNAIIFDCTDNKVARQSVEANLPAQNNVIISCGNEADFGQVMYSFVKCNTWGGDRYVELKDSINKVQQHIGLANPKKNTSISDFPTLLELFRDFKDTPTASCDEIILVNEQSMPINSLVAQLAYNMFYEIISGNSLNYYMVKCNVNNVFSTEFISSPSKCLRLLYKGIFGIDDIETAKLAIKDLACLGDYGWRRDSRAHEVLALCDKYPIFCIPQLTAYIKNAYYLSPINLQAMNDKLDENIKALNNYYGVTDDASV